MKMELKPFKELIAMSKEKIDEALAPMRARAVKARAELEMAKLEETRITLESCIQEMCVGKEINFKTLLDKMDEYDLNERRLKQYTNVLAQLFPKD